MTVDPHTDDAATIRSVIERHRYGSILTVGLAEQVEDALAALTRLAARVRPQETLADDDTTLIRDAIDGFFSELDQNKCVGSAERDANETERQTVVAALSRLVSRVGTLEAERELLTCPGCAHGFEPQEGRTYHDGCPGCKRALDAEAERDEARMEVERLQRLALIDLDARRLIETRADDAERRLADTTKALQAAENAMAYSSWSGEPGDKWLVDPERMMDLADAIEDLARGVEKEDARQALARVAVVPAPEEDET